MPAPVRLALETHQVMDAYLARPEFQRHGYLDWIARARLDRTRGNRLQQVLDELGRGNCYMRMAWRPRRPCA
ncbi:MAG: YdeI/OmpD-associated family protein [Lysobacter sp.]|nr:YdeI/OmpD-associated family protein [Lysobacter sp.]